MGRKWCGQSQAAAKTYRAVIENVGGMGTRLLAGCHRPQGKLVSCGGWWLSMGALCGKAAASQVEGACHSLTTAHFQSRNALKPEAVAVNERHQAHGHLQGTAG